MLLRDKLDIFIITYNRDENLDATFRQILGNESPIKDYEIKIIDNNSSDNTKEVVEKWMKDYPNVKYSKNKYNIGGNANIMKAFYKAEKEYVWILADNDYYCWDSWNEVEKAISDNVDAVMVSNFLWPETSVIEFWNQGSFLPGVIYKTSNIDDTVMGNMAFNISNMFPHCALFAKLMNENKKIYICNIGVVEIGENISKKNKTYSYTRGYNSNNMHPLLKDMTWYSGYANSLYLIKDKKIRSYIANNHRINGPTINSISAIVSNKKKELYILMSMFCVLDPLARLKFLLKYLYTLTLYNFIFLAISYNRTSPKGEYATRIQIRLCKKIKITFKWKKIIRPKQKNKNN